MLKKSAVRFSYHNLHSLHASAPASKTSSFYATPILTPTSTSPSTSTSTSTRQQQHKLMQRQQRRSYIVSDGHSTHSHGSLRWPEVTSADGIPTPYQIFGQKKGSPYSKRRWLSLVKKYHPDRHDISLMDGLSYTTRLERYRLVVAANEILSDPIKRSAYDTWGAGWNGAPDVAAHPDQPGSASHWGRCSRNATWEDWEEFYQENESKERQEPRFVSNSTFVGLIMTFALIGSVSQASRAGRSGTQFVEQRDSLHRTISEDLVRTRKDTTTAYGSREERIDNFIRQRDPLGYGVTDPREELYRNALPPPDMCSSCSS
ncbi:uncharacterized protein L3040_003645 [Drepanopeziza brunnea f. sp. 'multigermtubi']|uniref:uncharacterized protein n=1 Tax=Drepanopeziza brunnea f. sp. 'multigermtubi' TaxID=698441 RepID=UPI00239B6D10|nr:hypothetical protein L3040_003645 [Drepanopeziza brunnea f. sp. 'multigermtubi']